MPPEVIAGRYRVEREVGRGGMGSVWLCRDELLGRVVAVKRVSGLPGESTPDLARAMREARSTAALNHRHVVAVYDAVEEGDHLWLVMEYVPGRTLAEIMAAEGPLSPERVAWIGAQVADGLAAAHARGTVHRDVKPGNILVTDEDHAKISDFGIARTHGDPQLTGTGLVSGTPGYFAPEVARGDEATPASDVWSLGATLYSAVEGQAPYPKKDNALATLTMIASQRPSAPVRAGILAEPIGRMMDPDPGSRWGMADAAHTLHRLHERHAAAGTREEVAAGPPPTPTRPATQATAAGAATADAATPPPRRRRRPLLAALVVLLLLLVAGLGYLWWSSSADQPSASPGPSPHSRTPSPSPASTTSSPSQSPSSSPSTASPSTSGVQPPSHGGPSGFVTGYYSLLPDNTPRAWSMLSSDYQRQVGGYGSYKGFWDTIRTVDVTGTSPAGPHAVDVSLDYTRTDGSTASEVRRLYLESTGGGYVVTGDQVVG